MKRREWFGGGPVGLVRACAVGVLFAFGCGGGATRSGDTIVRFQLTTSQDVSGLESVRLTAGATAKTVPLQSLSPAATVIDVVVPSYVMGTLDVGAVARPVSGCNGYGGTNLAYIAGAGDTATVTIMMEPQDICQTTGAGGTTSAGTAGTGGSTGGATGGSAAGSGGTAGSGGAGTGGSTAGAGGAAGSGGAGAGGVVGTGGAAGGAGRGGTGGGVAGTGGTAGAAGRGGTGGSAGTGGAAGRGGTGGGAGAAGTGGAAGRGGTGGGAGAGGAGGGCNGTPGVLPSLTCCRQYDHAVTTAACDSNDTYVYAVAFSPDGRTMLTGGDDARVRVWDFDGRAPSDHGVALPASFYGYFALSPDGMNAAVGNNGAIDIYPTNNWVKLRSLTTLGGSVFGIGFAPDGQRVISIDSGDRIFVHSITNVTALSSTVATVFNNGLSIAATQLASGLGIAVPGTDGDLSLYSLTGTSTFSPETYFQATDYYAATTAFSPNGTLLAVGDEDSNTQFWNFPVPNVTTLPTGATISIGSSGGITDNVFGVAFSPNGAYIAITGGYNQGSVSIWNVSTRAMVSRFDLPAGHRGQSVAFSPNSSALVVGEHGCGKITVCSY